MGKFNILCVMRIKNEERWIDSCLKEASKVCDRILIIDDGSTDRTPEICRSFPKVKYRYYQRKVDELRDRRELLQWALENKADWILNLDGDEVLEEGAADRIRGEISRLDPRDPVYTYFQLHILYMWNNPELYRCENSIYGNFWISRLFTTWGQDKGRLIIGATGHGHNLHANGVPVNLRGKGRKIDVRIKHYGYMDFELRQKKYDFYQKHDPQAAAAGYYDHLTSEEGMLLARWTARTKGRFCPGLFIKPVGYYQFARPEVAELVPAQAIKILDVGCGHGNLGAFLKSQNQRREVFGIELDQMAAAAANNRLDKVLVGNIEKMRLDFPVGYFDCIILSDVLQHLLSPWDSLLYIKKFLSPKGCLILSVPNVKNFKVINHLINNGNWSYQDSGILERGHLRFFTVRNLQEMLVSVNMTPDLITGVPDPEVPDLPSHVETNKMVLKDLSLVEINELRTIRILARAKPCIPLAKSRGLVSIVIPVCNQLELTKLCLESIEYYTSEDYEIILVDNGSGEETAGYLKNLENKRLIRNDSNLGFAMACNQGMAAARGKYICLLNNDTIVSRGWLSHLARHLEENPAALAVGPVSNHAPDHQLAPVELQNIHDIETIAHHIRINNWLKSTQVGFLSGFCLLLKAKAKKIIGGFDTRFWPGNFEDDDYCLRIKLAGFELLIARDVFVAHFGRQTFDGEKVDYNEAMSSNWRRFREKWGLPENFNPVQRRTLADQLKGRYKKKQLFFPLCQEDDKK
ncbi:glycosyltransferase [Pelotomaculum propionicicum]|uniref:Putative glycosyltransferase EpsJ n=1 Tax=Pelotomaculum propionicicum TaxID=258475 RepID=A0A4Y7RKI5_9FIRM|nr:glycosyltransferase [Pelotomaculum propionicicum]NLI13370.1 glycosyltransferase [Peptococcaceae bacterium]TEB09518.1 putative glycosyltransferase EpsJ [Pelotomaculum propionicicum]